MKNLIRRTLFGTLGGVLLMILAWLLLANLAADSALRRGMQDVYIAVNAPVHPLLANMGNEEDLLLHMIVVFAWWLVVGASISFGVSVINTKNKRDRSETACYRRVQKDIEEFTGGA